MLLRDNASPQPDAAFIAMMKDFVAAQADRNPSTRDFQDAVEHHMCPPLDVAGDGKMDWFFRQWVEGTEIPRITAKLRADPAEDGRYRIQGTVSQAGVSDGFVSVVVLYSETKGEVSRVSRLILSGNRTVSVDLTVALPRPPDRAIVNALHDTLYRD